jgi:hypothetical protein
MRMEAVSDCRGTSGWTTIHYTAQSDVVSIPSLDLEMPLSELYERVRFSDSASPK